jgi:hypothetical protein
MFRRVPLTDLAIAAGNLRAAAANM